jgi:hypothetical protein
MEIIMDLLTSPLIHLDDQLELVAMAWENYSQYDQDIMVGYVEYDIYDLIGPSIEYTYVESGEYDLLMARAEAARIITTMAKQMCRASVVLQEKLSTHILPALAAMGDDTHIGAVRMVGGDLAIRLDNVVYTKSSDEVGGDTNQ